MNRKSFIKTSVVLSGSAISASAIAKPENIDYRSKDNRYFYEMRIYDLKDEQQQKLVEDYYQNAAIPALNRLGSKNIGVFTELKPAGQTRIFVLIPYKTIDDFVKVADNLTGDLVHQQTGQAYLQAPVENPAYQRISSIFMQAFDNTPYSGCPAAKKPVF